jgi:serine/threonine protein kinase
LSERGGHVILIDFGTAKDLIVTDLNGPEFVGTPDFMSPEAVKETKNGNGCDFTADLWAFGVVLYQLYAGALPFESQRYAALSTVNAIRFFFFFPKILNNDFLLHKSILGFSEDPERSF